MVSGERPSWVGPGTTPLCRTAGTATRPAPLVEELDWDELPKEEAVAQRAELRGVCAGGQLRLARVEGALPPLEQGARPRHDQLR